MDKNRKIYFICPKNSKPAGGVKQMYRMVDILNRNGFNASIVHKNSQRESWFSNETRIQKNPYIFKKIKLKLKGKDSFFNTLVLKYLRSQSINIEENAIVVFPEIYGDKISGVLPNDFVIFNQNCYYTFENFGNDAKADPYVSPKNKGVIVVSDDSLHYMKLAYPSVNVSRITLGIDDRLFHYSSEKKPQIAYMPRKLSNDAKQIITMLSRKPEMKNWHFAPIEDKSETEVSSILKDSSIFLSLNHKEGFGLPPVEAMAAGCYVIGYAGQGGKEYFKEDFTGRIPDGDISAFVEEVLRVSQNEKELKEKGQRASDFILQRYTFAAEEESILKFWNSIL